jgi:hypothetical protein
MTRLSSDSVFFITSPPEAEDNPDFSPFECSAPETIVYCCFFKSTQSRDRFLDTLHEHGEIDPTERMDPALEKRLRKEWLLSVRGGDHEIAMLTLIQWWTNVRRHTYHIYRLKSGYGPYPASCIISLAELSSEELRVNMVIGMDAMETRKRVILEEFGFGELGL